MDCFFITEMWIQNDDLLAVLPSVLLMYNSPPSSAQLLTLDQLDFVQSGSLLPLEQDQWMDISWTNAEMEEIYWQ